MTEATFCAQKSDLSDPPANPLPGLPSTCCWGNYTKAEVGSSKNQKSVVSLLCRTETSSNRTSNVTTRADGCALPFEGVLRYEVLSPKMLARSSQESNTDDLLLRFQRRFMFWQTSPVLRDSRSCSEIAFVAEFQTSSFPASYFNSWCLHLFLSVKENPRWEPSRLRSLGVKGVQATWWTEQKIPHSTWKDKNDIMRDLVSLSLAFSTSCLVCTPPSTHLSSWRLWVYTMIPICVIASIISTIFWRV